MPEVVTLRRIPNPTGETRGVGGRRRTEAKPTPMYEVLLDGARIGTVTRILVTRERRTPGRRYVNARWESLAWRSSSRDGYERTTRHEAVREVLEDRWPDRRWTELEQVAKAAKVVRDA